MTAQCIDFRAGFHSTGILGGTRGHGMRKRRGENSDVALSRGSTPPRRPPRATTTRHHHPQSEAKFRTPHRHHPVPRPSPSLGGVYSEARIKQQMLPTKEAQGGVHGEPGDKVRGPRCVRPRTRHRNHVCDRNHVSRRNRTLRTCARTHTLRPSPYRVRRWVL